MYSHGKRFYHKARIIPGVKAILPLLQLQMGASVSRGKIKNLLVYTFYGGMISQKQDSALELKKKGVQNACITLQRKKRADPVLEAPT